MKRLLKAIGIAAGVFTAMVIVFVGTVTILNLFGGVVFSVILYSLCGIWFITLVYQQLDE